MSSSRRSDSQTAEAATLALLRSLPPADASVPVAPPPKPAPPAKEAPPKRKHRLLRRSEVEREEAPRLRPPRPKPRAVEPAEVARAKPPVPLRTPAPRRAIVTEEDRASWIVRIAALFIIVLCGANIFYLRIENVSYYWYRPLLNAYSIGVGAFIISRFLIALFYRAPRPAGIEPPTSIIVTAYNEVDAIYRTVECCYAADYPESKLEVIVVDDGSTDGTLDELERAQQRWPGLKVVAFARNRGKREAMAAGARNATGDILVYVDSDSFVREDAIRQIVQGFADPAVAAVSGHTEVANRHVNALTRMQEVRYYVAFRIMKAAESLFGAVTCCPGCFSAYRKSCVLPVLEPWLNQRFLGVQATFGDDRSLTNFLLRNYKVIYDAKAVATTIVPEQHGRFLKQQIRWKKSWLRECLIAASFMWKKHPIAAVSFYAQLVFPIIAPLILIRAFVWLPFIQGDVLSMMVYAFGVLMIGCIFSAYYLFWKANAAWIYGAYFTIYYMLVLVWQMPWAIATSRDNSWGTR